MYRLRLSCSGGRLLSYLLFFFSMRHKIRNSMVKFTFFEFIRETSWALEWWGEVRVLLWWFTLLLVTGSSFLYLLRVEKVWSSFGTGVRNYLVLLISWIIYLVPVNDMSLFFPSLLLLFALFIGFINYPNTVLNRHSLHLDSTKH